MRESQEQFTLLTMTHDVVRERQLNDLFASFAGLPQLRAVTLTRRNT